MKRRIDAQLNDGFLNYGVIVTERDSQTKAKKGEAFQTRGSLAFSFESIRQQDTEVYSTNETTLDLKVKTYYTSGLTKSHKVLLENETYSIIQMDPTKDRRYIYWYLMKVGEFNGNVE